MMRTLLTTLLLATAALAAEELRPMATDRPGVTNTPYTVDKGHFQLEVDIVKYLREKEGGNEFTRLTLGAINVKFGVTDTIDVQLLFDAYLDEELKLEGDPTVSNDGVGDTVVRVKINLFGNDDEVAIAVIPFIRIPTSASGLAGGTDEVEGGILIPIEARDISGFNLAFQLGLDIVRGIDNAHHLDVIVSGVATHRIVGRLDGFFELVARWPGLAGAEVQTGTNIGVIYTINANLTVDCGVFLGITSPSTDFEVFLGLSKRW